MRARGPLASGAQRRSDPRVAEVAWRVVKVHGPAHRARPLAADKRWLPARVGMDGMQCGLQRGGALGRQQLQLNVLRHAAVPELGSWSRPAVGAVGAVVPIRGEHATVSCLSC